MATIAISGPRAGQLYGYDYNAYKRLEETFLNYITQLCDGDSTVIVSSDQGAGQCAFRAAMRARLANPYLKVHVYSAFPGEQAAWSISGDFGQEDYIRMCEAADHVRDCSQSMTDGTNKDRSSARHARANLMTKKANGVIAVSDFTDAARLEGVPGEVAHLMRSALENKTYLWAMDPNTLELTNLSDAAHPPSDENRDAIRARS